MCLSLTQEYFTTKGTKLRYLAFVNERGNIWTNCFSVLKHNLYFTNLRPLLFIHSRSHSCCDWSNDTFKVENWPYMKFWKCDETLSLEGVPVQYSLEWFDAFRTLRWSLSDQAFLEMVLKYTCVSYINTLL